MAKKNGASDPFKGITLNRSLPTPILLETKLGSSRSDEVDQTQSNTTGTHPSNNAELRKMRGST